MSWTTSVILLFNLAEEYHEDEDSISQNLLPEYTGSAALGAVNMWLKERDHSELADLSNVQHPVGNLPACNSGIHIGCFNHLDSEEFRDVVFAQAWRIPEFVQLLVKDEMDRMFTVYTPGASRPRDEP